jgi:hypothetical protein
MLFSISSISAMIRIYNLSKRSRNVFDECYIHNRRKWPLHGMYAYSIKSSPLPPHHMSLRQSLVLRNYLTLPWPDDSNRCDDSNGRTSWVGQYPNISITRGDIECI